MSPEEKYRAAVETINNAGGTPFPITETLVAIVKKLVREDEVDFILSFKNARSQTMEQLKETSGLTESEIHQRVKTLAKRGVIFNQPNRSGKMVFRLLPLVNVGAFEYRFMGKLEHTEENSELGRLFSNLFREVKEVIQDSYDGVVSFMEHIPPVDRTVPVLENKATGNKIVIEINEDLGTPIDRILPAQQVEEIIEKFDEIAVGHCFCRHYHDVIGESCKQTDQRENCFTFGKSARYTSEQGFSRMITREEALVILKKAEEDGLVHKAYHPAFDVNKDETSICNCCKCCCGNGAEQQIGPIVNAAGFLAKVNVELCIGCGTCVTECHTNAIELNESNKAEHDESRCIGCGVCAYFCPENAIRLERSERTVRIPPPRLASVHK